MGLLLWLGASSAGAVEPVRVSAQGVVPITQENESSLRARATDAALREAVFRAALGYVAEDRRSGREDELRAALGAKAVPLVLTYTLEGAPQRRADPEDSTREQFVVTVNATVDGEQLRALLKERGWIQGGPARPSLVLRVVSLGQPAGPQLLELERYLVKKLADRGYVLVDPALSPNAAPGEKTIDLARRVGADIAIEVTVRRQALEPRTATSVGGALAEAGIRAVRVQDVTEIALSRFEAPGYNASAEVAFATALEGVRDQLAQSLIFQLDRNVTALGPGSGTVTLRLAGVTTLLQVEAVQRALVEQLGARSVALSVLEPRAVELVVEGPLSPGALQERLGALAFDGFSLEVSSVEASSVSLRVLPVGERPESPGPAAPGRRSGLPQIDTRGGNG